MASESLDSSDIAVYNKLIRKLRRCKDRKKQIEVFTNLADSLWLIAPRKYDKKQIKLYNSYINRLT